MKTLRYYKCSISSTIDNIASAVDEVTSYLRGTYGIMGECALFELRIILNELILNAVKHGNKEDEDKYVKIVAAVTRKRSIIIIIEDEGEGYNYNCLIQTHDSINTVTDLCELKETGRGVLIVRNLCDCIKFNKKGNRITILKKLNVT